MAKRPDSDEREDLVRKRTKLVSRTANAGSTAPPGAAFTGSTISIPPSQNDFLSFYDLDKGEEDNGIEPPGADPPGADFSRDMQDSGMGDGSGIDDSDDEEFEERSSITLPGASFAPHRGSREFQEPPSTAPPGASFASSRGSLFGTDLDFDDEFNSNSITETPSIAPTRGSLSGAYPDPNHEDDDNDDEEEFEEPLSIAPAPPRASFAPTRRSLSGAYQDSDHNHDDDNNDEFEEPLSVTPPGASFARTRSSLSRAYLDGNHNEDDDDDDKSLPPPPPETVQDPPVSEDSTPAPSLVHTSSPHVSYPPFQIHAGTEAEDEEEFIAPPSSSSAPLRAPIPFQQPSSPHRECSARIRELSHSKTELERECAAHQERSAAMDENLSQLRIQIAGLRSSHAHLGSKLSSTTLSLRTLQTQSEKQIAGLKTEIEEERRRGGEREAVLRERNIVLEKEVGVLRREMEDSRKRAEEEVRTVGMERATAVQEKETLITALHNKSSECEALQVSLQSLVQSHERECQNLQHKLTTQSAAHSRKRRADAAKYEQKYEQALEDKKREEERLRQELQKEKQRTKDMKQKHTELESRFTALQNAHQDLVSRERVTAPQSGWKNYDSQDHTGSYYSRPPTPSSSEGGEDGEDGEDTSTSTSPGARSKPNTRIQKLQTTLATLQWENASLEHTLSHTLHVNLARKRMLEHAHKQPTNIHTSHIPESDAEKQDHDLIPPPDPARHRKPRARHGRRIPRYETQDERRRRGREVEGVRERLVQMWEGG